MFAEIEQSEGFDSILRLSPETAAECRLLDTLTAGLISRRPGAQIIAGSDEGRYAIAVGMVQ